jgi:hypothetical protein
MQTYQTLKETNRTSNVTNRTSERTEKKKKETMGRERTEPLGGRRGTEKRKTGCQLVKKEMHNENGSTRKGGGRRGRTISEEISG